MAKKNKIHPWRWKHVPTGLYWFKRTLVNKGNFKVWSNLHVRGRIFETQPFHKLVAIYSNPDDSYNYKKSSPLRISKPGEWIIEPFYGKIN